METKKRHGCVTAWLILMIVLNALTAVTWFFFNDVFREQIGEGVNKNTMLALGLIGLLNLVFAIMLFRWKKWAFWGFLITSLIAFGINLSLGLGIGQSAMGLLGIIVLYAVFQIKADGRTAWSYLE